MMYEAKHGIIPPEIRQVYNLMSSQVIRERLFGVGFGDTSNSSDLTFHSDPDVTEMKFGIDATQTLFGKDGTTVTTVKFTHPLDSDLNETWEISEVNNTCKLVLKNIEPDYDRPYTTVTGLPMLDYICKTKDYLSFEFKKGSSENVWELAKASYRMSMLETREAIDTFNKVISGECIFYVPSERINLEKLAG